MTLNSFPSTPTLAWSVQKVPNWATRFQRAISGRELRVSDYVLPVYTFVLTFNILRDSWDQRLGYGVGDGFNLGGPYNDLRNIWAFYNGQQGPAIPFLFSDPSDDTTRLNPSTPTVFDFAVGDGITTSFQMASPLLAPVIPNVVTSVTPAISHTIDLNSGIITFTSAPGAAVPVGADFTFYYKVRFSEDNLPAENFLYQLWNMKQLKLTSVLF